jgi:hypothetical protein
MSLTWNWVAIALSLTTASPNVGGPAMGEMKEAIGKLKQLSPSPDRSEGPAISYRVRVVEMEGLGWRETWLGKMSHVSRRGSATVWTAPRHASDAIFGRASKVVTTLPKVTSHANTAAHLTSRKNRSLVTQVSWSEDAPKMTSESIREGFATTIAGRKLDQGVLVQVVIDDTDIRSIHEVKLDSRMEADAPDLKNPKDFVARPKPVIQVPEVVSQELAGEWLIPNQSTLIVGLGVHTAEGKDGKAVVRERLVLIDAVDVEILRTAARIDENPRTSTLPPPAPSPSPSAEQAPPPPPPAPAGSVNINPADPMPTPEPPSRTLPQGVHADGTPAELPPLPEEADMTEGDDSAEPHGSPQHRAKPGAIPMPVPPTPDAKEKKTVDPASTKTAYAPTPVKASVTVRPSVGFSVVPEPFPASLVRWIEAAKARRFVVKPMTTSPTCDEKCHDTDCCDAE